MKSGMLAVLIFVAGIAILLLVLHYFKILALLALLIGLGVLVGIIILVLIAGILVIVALPYYLVTKEPTIDEQGSYTLADVKGKDEDEKRSD
jgi:membrane protein implicated in regulation of membrane protease activity